MLTIFYAIEHIEVKVAKGGIDNCHYRLKKAAKLFEIIHKVAVANDREHDCQNGEEEEKV
jgi:hypothetical protein